MAFAAADRSTTPLNPEAKLALGTIKLEGTKQAVDPKMAAKLIPLWQLLAQLNSSSSSAPQEVTAVVDQIKSTMTPDQVKTINGMKLTQADIFTAFQDRPRHRIRRTTSAEELVPPAEIEAVMAEGSYSLAVVGLGPSGRWCGQAADLPEAASEPTVRQDRATSTPTAVQRRLPRRLKLVRMPFHRS